MIRLSLALALALAMAVVLGAPAQPVMAASACTKLRPAGLQFERKTGKTDGMLRWARPRQPGGADAYRVLRDRKVVGQTTRRAMRVAVSLGRTYRFAVVPVSGGHPTGCATTKRIRVVYRPPGAPRRLTIAGDEGGLKLTWEQARRGDAKVAGYRLRRDGETVGQRKGTSWQLPATVGRKHRFTVVAVDRSGRAGKPSNAVTALVGHEPPTVPADLRLAVASDTAVDAAWGASVVKSGQITGYRLLRDDAVVGQVSATQARIDNLAPSTDYRVAVVAIDSYGYASAPAAAATRTADPVPTTGHAHAYLLASTDQSFADFRAHYRQIAVVHPTYYDCTGAAALDGADDALITRWAQARKVEVLPRVNCQRTAVVSRILTDAAVRKRWLDQLVQLARDVGYDGISLDFEAGPAADRAKLSSFVEELAARLHADGRKLAVAVSPKTRDILDHPRSGIFDYPRLAQAADYLFLMTWGLHWSTSAPGPQDDLTWVRQVVDYVAALPDRHKFIYGTNLYALDWPVGPGPQQTAVAYEYQDIVPFLPGLGAQVALDPTSDNYQALYTDGNGVPREVWFPDVATTSRRIAIAREAGLGGVGFWRLGREDQRVWDLPAIAPEAAW